MDHLFAAIGEQAVVPADLDQRRLGVIHLETGNAAQIDLERLDQVRLAVPLHLRQIEAGRAILA